MQENLGYIMHLREKVGKMPLIQAGSAMIFVNDEGKILMIKNKTTQNWGFPGGSLELAESLEECARREAKEETGLDAGKIEFLDVFSGNIMHYFYPNGDEVYNVAAIYTCSDYSGELIPDHIECDEAQYFDPDDLPEKIVGFCLKIVACYKERY